MIARFDDGAPAMVEGDAGSGKVVIWATTVDEYWTDLPTQPVYLPFVHQLGKQVGRYSDTRAWFTAGDVLDLSRHAELTRGLLAFDASAADSGALVLEAPSGERERLSMNGTTHLARLTEHGFYELRGPTTPVDGGRPIAVNVDPAEADLTHMDPQELIAAAGVTTAKVESVGTMTATPEDQERRQTIWWYLMLAAVFLLAVETVMSNRLSRVSG